MMPRCLLLQLSLCVWKQCFELPLGEREETLDAGD